METQRSVVPAACAIVILAFGWFVVHRSSAAAPDPTNDARRALVQTCAQRNIAPYATWCVPDGWKLEARPPGNPSDAPNIESTARDNEDPGGARLHLNGPTGMSAQMQVMILPDVPSDTADALGDDANSASRQAAIAALIDRSAVPGGFTPQAGGQFLPAGTVPHGEVYATRRSDKIAEWLVFRGSKRISIMGIPGLVNDGTALGSVGALDMALITPAVDRLLATWAWADDWADAPDTTELLKQSKD